MTHIIQEWHVLTALAGLAIALPVGCAIDAAAKALARRRARRRQVKGSRVNAPEWRARRLTNGSWIVERRK
jgi:hypothetical protein